MGLAQTVEELEAAQRVLAAETPNPYIPSGEPRRVAGVMVCFGRGGSGPGAAGDRGWAGAVTFEGARCIETTTVTGIAGAPYQPGLLALREGGLLVAAIEQLRGPYDLLMVNATGRDHPRHGGLALHLGAHFEVPSVGVTHRPLLGAGEWPRTRDRGARAPLTVDSEIVGYWICTRTDTRPLVAHGGWRTDPEVAAELVLASAVSARTPEPLRTARRLAREARSRDAG